ncbi:diguanylate cyclase [Sphingomonas sp. BK481]|uniref:sensor domain-containing diguanylate cyclase n=1 Tax=Sphingomonas sp. BK481 TaxID=2586981 RepID=UPI00160FEC2D|nr:diguanylate cyclase [Sphingomonas sp. BK481]
MSLHARHSESFGMDTKINVADGGGRWDMANAPFVVDALARSIPTVQFSMEGEVLAVNDRYLRIFGREAQDLIGGHHSSFVRLTAAGAADYATVWNTLRKGRLIQTEFGSVARDGREVWLQATYMPVLDSNGVPQRVFKLANDITHEHQHAADKIKMLEAISRSTAMIEFALDGTILSANPLYLAITGYTETDIRGRHHRMFVTPEDACDPSYERFWERLREGEFIRSEFRRIGRDGRPIWLQASYNPILDACGKPTRIVKIATDITESVELRLENAHHAFSDALTQLANRRRFNRTLAEEVRRAIRSGDDLSLILIDIDHFKRFNDNHGHQQGDACLRIVATAIRSAVRRANDLVARFGGEEFALLLPSAGADVAATAAETIRAAVETLRVDHQDGTRPVLTVSVGHASLSRDHRSADVLADDLVERADRALYRAKEAGRNTVCDDRAIHPRGSATPSSRAPLSRSISPKG